MGGKRKRKIKQDVTLNEEMRGEIKAKVGPADELQTLRRVDGLQPGKLAAE